MRYRPATHAVASRVVRGAAAAAVTMSLFAGATGSAAAQSTGQAAPSVAQLRAEADAIANDYFAALTKFESLDADITRGEQMVAILTARANQAKADAKARALIAYKNSGSELNVLISSSSSIDTAHRVHLIDRVNAHDAKTYSTLRSATRDLQQHQQALHDARQQQADALGALRGQGATLDAKLADAARQEQAAVTVAAGATTTTSSALGSSAPGSTTAPAATPVAATPPASGATPTPPPGYSGTPGTSSHHDDPFLSCVRARESGGNYGAVNPAGPYLGAYQFLQATWNGAANHAGRGDLVGVPVNVASPYDQDEVAWSLYQWQGAGPWGGSCS